LEIAGFLGFVGFVEFLGYEGLVVGRDLLDYFEGEHCR
jgi:hypothetical protein